MEIIESLESRRLFSAVPFFQLTSKGTLIIHGTVEANEIEVFFVHGKASQGVGAIVGVPDHGLQRLSNIYRAKANAVKRIWIDAGGGNDSIGVSQVTYPATILGGGGDDGIGADRFGPMVAYGGAGNDSMGGLPDVSAFDSTLNNQAILDNAFNETNSTPVNTLNGGAGDDTLFGDTNDKLNGGAGHDEADLFASTLSTHRFSVDRLSGLAHNYYQRIGAVSIEQPMGIQMKDEVVTTGNN